MLSLSSTIFDFHSSLVFVGAVFVFVVSGVTNLLAKTLLRFLSRSFWFSVDLLRLVIIPSLILIVRVWIALTT